jgi:Ca-activated chloride channel family protein
VFTPRPHTPRVRGGAVPTPDLAAFPRLVRSSKCTRAGGTGRPVVRAAPSLKKQPSPAPYRPYADNTPAGATGAAPKPVLGGAAAPAQEAERPYASMDDDDRAAEPATGGESTSKAGYAPAGPKDRAEERRQAREERKNKRDKKREAAAPATETPSPVADEASAVAYEPYIEPPPVQPVQPIAPLVPPSGEGWGDATYLSNDDTMSLSSAQRILYAIDRFLPLPLDHVRPHELLNYFSFETTPVAEDHDFSVRAEIAPEPDAQGLHGLTLAVQGRSLDYASRRNAALTLVVDRSGSMKEEGRMDYLKRGLQRMVSELKAGDVVHLVTFDERVCVPLQNFVVGRDDPQILRKAISDIRPRGQTDVHGALVKGYELADDTYQATHSNRVLLISDALANTGVTDPSTMAMVSDWYDARRIRLSGIGVGREFDDALLDQLTEAGRGAYVFLGSEAEVDAVFGHNFVSLIETTANDVHFRLHLPSTLRMYRFHGEESSTHKEDVQAIHYFANTSQLFFSEVEPWQGALRPQDWIMLEIEYLDPESGAELVEDHAFRLGDIARASNNLRKAQLVTSWVEGLAAIAARPLPHGWNPREQGWVDPYAWQTCQDQRERLRAGSEGLGDPEVQNLLGLWDRYCLRYERSGRPPRKDERSPGWPGARG